MGARYGPLDLWWFDGEWERTPEEWDMAGLRGALLARSPGAVFNARLTGYGDYATPEQGVPITPPEVDWEFCVTVNDSWGYQGRDTNWKSVGMLVRMFAETIGMGGNMLLDVGPREDGTIPERGGRAARRARRPGSRRTRARSTAPARGSRRGSSPARPPARRTGASSTSSSSTRPGAPRAGGEIAVKGLLTRPTSVRHLATGTELPLRAVGGLGEVPPVYWIEVPTALLEEHAAVVTLSFDEPFALYTGAGRD